MSVVAAAIVLTTALQLVRQRGDASWQTVWAEDGRVYFTDAIDDGVTAVVDPYPEYLVLVPRAVAIPTPFLPLDDVDLYFAVAGALLTAVIAAGVFWATSGLIHSLVLRVLLALAVMFHPLTVGADLIANVAYVIVPLTFLAFLMVLRRPGTPVEAAVASGVCAVAALSQFLVALFVPMALLLALRRRSREMWIVTTSLVAASAGQLIAVLVAGDESKRFGTDYADLAPLYGIRVVGSAVFGENNLDDAWLHVDYWLLLLVPLLGLGLGLLAVRCEQEVRLLAGLCLLYSVAMFIVPTALRGTRFETLHEGSWAGGASRFAALGLWLLLAGTFLLVDRARVTPPTRTALVTVLALQFVVLAVTGFRAESGRSVGPTWQASLAAARAECAATGAEDVRVQVSPPTRPWRARVPCSRVLR